MTDLFGKSDAARLRSHLRLLDGPAKIYRLADVRSAIKDLTPVRRARTGLRMLRSKGQSDETTIIERLAVDCSKTFIEFGFHPAEFNCATLARRHDWDGLLVDGDAGQVADAKFFLPSRIAAVQKFLTLDNIDFLKAVFPALGVLSIDVDGNDYWFLERLIDIRPAVICVEYNSTFGQAPISVPYDPGFDRHEKHPRGWYHGASLTALAWLCRKHGYGLAAVSDGGANAFFTAGGRLDPAHAWRPNRFREIYSGVSHDLQWQAVKDLPFVDVTCTKSD